MNAGSRRLLLTAFVLVMAAAAIVSYRVVRARRKAAERAQRKDAASVDGHYRERIAVLQFTEALRREMAWHAGAERPRTEADRRRRLMEMAERMARVSVSGLPADLEAAWNEMKDAWKALAAAPEAPPDVVARGSAAATRLNAVLAERGFPDLHF